VELDGRGAESPAVVAQHDPAAESGRFVRQFPHAVPFSGAGGAVGGGLDEQPALGREPGAALFSPGLTAATSAIDAAWSFQPALRASTARIHAITAAC